MVTENDPIRGNRPEGPGGSRDAAEAAHESFAAGKSPAQGECGSPGRGRETGAPVRRGQRGRKKNRLATDAAREVRFTFSRFLSILVLAALAVAFLAGLRTTAPDMEYTADNYYDRTHMMDGYVISTLGLTQEDLDALASAPGVTQVEGEMALDAIAQDAVVTVRSLPERLNLLEVTQGRLPQEAGECVTESLLLIELGLEIGDTVELVLDEDDEGSLRRTSYTIVGVADSPLYVGADRGSSSLGGGSVDAFVFVPGENFDMDYYTQAYFTLDGLAQLDSYGQEYEDRLEDGLDALDPLAEERAQLRYDTMVADAQKEIDEGQQELDDARQQLADAEQELKDARAELDDGWAQYYEGRATLEREIADARQTLANALSQLRSGEAEYADGQTQYQDGLAQYQQGLAEYEDNLALLQEQQAQVDEGYAQYEAALAPYEGTPYYDAIVEQLAPQKAQLDAAQAQLTQGFAQLEAGKAVLDETKAVLDDSAAQLSAARAELDSGWNEYYSGQATLDREEQNGRQELADALAELEDGEAQYADGLQEYEDGLAEAEEEIADGEAQLADAREELAALDGCDWYVLGRTTNAGFSGYSQDAERVGNLASIFPVIFFLVAALACLTTMTRMVEDQRTQIGALKALGFSRFAISRKYIGYAFWASFLGGVLGLAVGCTLFPAVIANAFDIMYNIPQLEYKFQPVICVVAVLAAVACTTGAALWACLSTLIDTPANLMRPKAPKPGRRVFLEYIKPLWGKLTFTWKVTMRNLFRYQRRFWMTVIGIGGCTALIVTGFGLHESIFDILDKQFDEISLYDATAGLEEDPPGEELARVTDYLAQSDAVDRYLLCHQEAADVSLGRATQSVYLFSVGDIQQFGQFIQLRHRLDDQPVTLDDEGVILTEKLAELLDAQVGDTIVLEGDKRAEVKVADIVENYVYHYVYMTDACYQRLFGQTPQASTILVAYTDAVDQAQSDQVSADLMAMDAVTSYSYIATIRDSFTDSMNAINYAVVIIILAAAALAFVVLYNLTNINITERMRELATLKVLGFYDREITAYVYRENIFLTAFGIILGLVLGRFLHAWMVVTVEVDIVMFGRTAPPYAYVLAAVLTAVFSVVVNIAAHFRLKKVDMVESLKTVE